MNLIQSVSAPLLLLLCSACVEPPEFGQSSDSGLKPHASVDGGPRAGVSSASSVIAAPSSYAVSSGLAPVNMTIATGSVTRPAPPEAPAVSTASGAFDSSTPSPTNSSALSLDSSTVVDLDSSAIASDGSALDQDSSILGWDSGFPDSSATGEPSGSAEVLTCDSDVDPDCPCASGEPRVRYCADGDGDGYCSTASCAHLACPGTAGQGWLRKSICEPDCDDAHAAVHPSVQEMCNGVDDDCNGFIDEGLEVEYCPDADGDGYCSASCEHFACQGSTGSGFLLKTSCGSGVDCDDTRNAVHPEQVDTCNSIDDDCDGPVDEDFQSGVCSILSGLGACKDAGTTTCTSSGAVTCSGPTPSDIGQQQLWHTSPVNGSWDWDCSGAPEPEFEAAWECGSSSSCQAIYVHDPSLMDPGCGERVVVHICGWDWQTERCTVQYGTELQLSCH